MINKALGLLAASLVLIASGVALRKAAVVEEGLASVQQQLATSGRVAPALQGELETSLAAVNRVPVLGAHLTTLVHRRQVEAAYWQRHYDSLRVSAASASGDDRDSHILMLSANAGFRRALGGDPTPQVLVQSLDTVAKEYAEVLEVAPDAEDAAFNYEYVVRLRQAIAQGRRPSPPPSQHQLGDEGGPPAGSDDGDFKIIVPLEPQERQDQTTPGGAPQIRRRG